LIISIHAHATNHTSPSPPITVHDVRSYVDYTTQKRYPKASAAWYAKLVRVFKQGADPSNLATTTAGDSNLATAAAPAGGRGGGGASSSGSGGEYIEVPAVVPTVTCAAVHVVVLLWAAALRSNANGDPR
jgi:hypothetical protein